MIALLLFVFTATIYLQTFSTSIYGADSGDLVSAAVVGGIAHPPGYPLYLILARLFLLIPSGEPAAKINLFSLVTLAAVVSLVYLLTFKLTKDRLTAMISSLVLAFTVPFWLYASIAEVYPLNSLFVVLLFYLAITITGYVETKKQLPFFLIYLFSLTCGLAITQSWYTLVLITPSLAILLWPYRNQLTKKVIITSVGFLLLGLAPYLYAPIASLSNPPLNWDNPKTITGLAKLITLSDYGTITPAKDLYGGPGLERLTQLFWFISFLINDFKLIGLIIALAGVVYLYKANKRWFWAFLVGFLIAGPIFLIYTDYPTTSPFLLGVIEQFVFTPYLFLAIFFAFGLAYAMPLIVKKISQQTGLVVFKKKAELISLGLKLLVILLPLYLIVSNFEKVNLKGVTTGDKLGLDVLTTVEPGSILILQDDTVTFNTEYAYYGLKSRPDVAIIVPGHMRHQYYRDYLKSAYPQLSVPNELSIENKGSGYLNARYTTELVGKNLGRFPIYSYSVGPSVSDWQWLPVGILIKLVPKNQKPDLVTYADLNSEVWQRYKFNQTDYRVGYKQLTIEHVIGVYQFGHLNAAKYFLELGNNDLALAEIDKALEIDPWFVEGLDEKGMIGLSLKNCSMASEAFLKALSIDKNNPNTLFGMRNYYQQCDKDNQDKLKQLENQIEQLRPKDLNIPLDKF